MSMLDTILDPDRCEFVQQPPDYLHVKCPVCLDILLPEPYLVSCCGNHFCQRCISSIGKYDPCPLCKAKHNAQFKVPDKGLTRTLNSLNIYCPNRDKSCDWAGPLETVYNHISIACPFVLVPCKYKCGSSVIRSDLEIHESQRCPQRPETCKHCHSFSAMYIQIRHHERKCTKAEISCPNECGARFLRESQSGHVETCPKVSVTCTFSYVGCKWAGTREALETHHQREWKDHISLISLHMTEVVKSQDEVISTLLTQIEKQERTIKDLALEVKGLRPLKSTTMEIESSRRQPSGASAQTKSHTMITSEVSLPFVPADKKTLSFLINGFNLRKNKNMSHYSPAFVVSSNTGYSMQLTVYLNGVEAGRGTHVSVYVNIIASHYDDWVTACTSCQAKVLVRLRSQTDKFPHHEEVITFEESSFGAVGSFMSQTGKLNGSATFIKHTALAPAYLKNDCLMFELPQVIV